MRALVACSEVISISFVLLLQECVFSFLWPFGVGLESSIGCYLRPLLC